MANKNTKPAPKVIVKKKGGFFGRLISFLMGMIMGVVAIFGGIAAIVMFVLSKPVQETYDTIEQNGIDIPGELTDYINGDFATLTLLEAFTAIGQTLGGVINGANTLGELADISPFLEEQFASWATALTEFGVATTKDDLLGLNFTNVGDYFMGKVDEISIVSLFGDVSGSDSFMCSLLYGKKNVHYLVDEENKAIPAPLAYTYSSEDDNFTDWNENVYTYATQDGVQGWVNAELQQVIVSDDSTSEDGTVTYTYKVCSAGDASVTVYNLAQSETDPTKYNAYVDDTLQKHRGLTIGDLKQGNFFDNKLNDMELYSLLNMNASTDKVMLTLAGYEVKDGEAVLQEGKEPTTLGELKTNASSLVNDMKIADVMDVSPDNKLMMSLAYVDGDPNGEARTLGELKENSSDIINDMKVADLITIESDNNLMMSVAYVDGDTTRPRTLEDLSNDKNLVNNMKVYVALDLPINDADKITPIMRAIAFGKQYKGEEGGDTTGCDYKIVYNSETEKNEIVMLEGSDYKTIDSIKDTSFIDTLELGEIITVTDDSSQILQTLQFTPVGELSTTIDGLELNQVIKIDSSSPQILQYLSDAKIGGDGADNISNKIDNLTLKDALGEEKCEENTLLNSMKEWRINDLGDNIDTLKLNQVITIDSSSPQILQALATATLGGDDENAISNKVETITIEEMMGADKVEGNFILKHLSDATLTTLSGKIEELTIQQVFADDIYKKVYYDNNNTLISTPLFKNSEDGKYYTDEEYTSEYTGTVNEYFIGNCGHTLKKNDDDTFSHVENNSTCEGKPVLTGTWKYLLTNPETKQEETCSIKKINSLIGNMTGNIQNATLSELNNDGLLELDSALLSKTFPELDENGNVILDPTHSSGFKQIAIGNLTIKKLIETIATYADDPE